MRTQDGDLFSMHLVDYSVHLPSFRIMGNRDFPGGLDIKETTSNAGDLGSIPGSGRSSGEGNGYPLQYSCLENPWTEEPGGLQSMGSQREWT